MSKHSKPSEPGDNAAEGLRIANESIRRMAKAAAGRRIELAPMPSEQFPLGSFHTALKASDRSWLAHTLNPSRPPYWRRVWDALKGY